LLGNPLVNPISRFHYHSPQKKVRPATGLRLKAHTFLTRKAFPLFSVLSGDVTTVFRFPPGIAGKAMFFSQGFCRRLVYLR